MKTDQILSSNVLDIIFDGRNKMYGAYNLRMTYNARLNKSMLFTASVALVVSLSAVFANTNDNDMLVIDFADHTMASAKVKPTLVRPHSKPAVKSQANEKKLNKPVVVVDKLVTKSDVLTEISEEAIGLETIGSGDKGQIDAPTEEYQSKVFEALESKKDKEEFKTVEIEAEFPGGDAAWAKYLKRNLNGNTPVDNGAPAGIYQVIVQFMVSKDGNISDVHTVTTYGYGMEDEAIKIINRGPKWKPALQNGRNVNAYRSQPITFIVE